jgi:hypothetical protein
MKTSGTVKPTKSGSTGTSRRFRLVDKRAGKDGRYFLLVEQIARVTKRTPRVDDIVNKQHRATGKVKLGVADEAQATRTFSPKAAATQPYKLDARIAANAMECADKICDKDEAANQQSYDHEIVRKALYGHARELLDAGSDLMLVEEFGDLSFGHASLHFPCNPWASSV